MSPNLPKFIPQDKHAKSLKAGHPIVPRPNPAKDVENGICKAKLGATDTFYIYRKDEFIGVWVMGGYFAPVAGFENMDRCASLAVERWFKVKGVVNA